jgi:hypothetical protein
MAFFSALPLSVASVKSGVLATETGVFEGDAHYFRRIHFARLEQIKLMCVGALA